MVQCSQQEGLVNEYHVRQQSYLPGREGSDIVGPSPLAHIGSANGYNVFTDAADKEIRLHDNTFIETSTVLEILHERQREPGPEWSEICDIIRIYGERVMIDRATGAMTRPRPGSARRRARDPAA
jgi:hypothetical protein